MASSVIVQPWITSDMGQARDSSPRSKHESPKEANERHSLALSCIQVFTKIWSFHSKLIKEVLIPSKRGGFFHLPMSKSSSQLDADLSTESGSSSRKASTGSDTQPCIQQQGQRQPPQQQTDQLASKKQQRKSLQTKHVKVVTRQDILNGVYKVPGSESSPTSPKLGAATMARSSSKKSRHSQQFQRPRRSMSSRSYISTMSSTSLPESTKTRPQPPVNRGSVLSSDGSILVTMNRTKTRDSQLSTVTSRA